jgi:hypothetical protein
MSVPSKPGHGQADSPTRVLYLARVRDRDDEAEAEKLRAALLELFSPFGEVEDVTFPTGKKFAFVVFADVESASRARSELHDKNVDHLVPESFPIKRFFIRFASELPRTAKPNPPPSSSGDAAEVINPSLRPPSEFTNCDSSCTDLVRNHV